MKTANRVVWGKWCMRIVFKMADNKGAGEEIILSCECSTTFILERNYSGMKLIPVSCE